MEKKYLAGTEIEILPDLEQLLEPINTINPDPSNPRITKELDTLKLCIKRFGLRKPIVVNKKDNLIEAGHQTYRSLVELGATEIPVIWADDERLDAIGFNIADNRTFEKVAVWDEKVLTGLLVKLNTNWDISGIGYTEKEIYSLEEIFNNNDDELDDLELPSLNDQPPEEFSRRIIISYKNEEESGYIRNKLGLKENFNKINASDILGIKG